MASAMPNSGTAFSGPLCPRAAFMRTSVLTSSRLRRCRNVRTNVCGSRWMPTHTPLTKILVLVGMTDGLISSSDSVVHSSRNSMSGVEGDPTAEKHYDRVPQI